MSIIKLPWSEFKTMHRAKKIPIQVRETENAYELSIPERAMHWTTYVFKESDPRYDAEAYADWAANYKDNVNGPIEPRTDDGRLMMQPVTLDKGIWHWFCGAGDDPTNGKAEGQPFMISSNVPNENKNVTWQFNDWVVLVGGVAKYRNASLGDRCDFRMDAPASVAYHNAQGTGNCNKVPTGLGFSIIVPAMGDGAFDINLATDAIPIPSEDKTGYWEWTWPDVGRGSFTPAPGNGHYNLFDVPIPMVRLVARVPMLGAGTIDFAPQHAHPTYILPHWVLQCQVTHADTTEKLEMIWLMMMARKKTT